MKILFWTSVAFVFYTYAGYPMLIALLARLFPRPVGREACTPLVSVIVAVRNEQRSMARRLDNLLAQDYPPDRYQVVVVSDGSTDRTNEIVASYAGRNVILVPLAETGGKAAALNHGVARAEGEIVVFADARQIFAPDAVRRLAANFADSAVGCASGELILLDRGGSGAQVEMGAYWRYEKVIRKLESASGSVVGATGAIYAIRKGLYSPLPPGTILDDLLVPMTVARRGYRVVFDGSPKAYDEVSKGMDQEWTRKVRTLAGNFQLLGLYPSFVVPWLSPLWWRFLSHKIFRLLVPFALPCLLAASLSCQEFLYRSALCVQVLFYVTVLCGYLVPPLRKVRLVNLAVFFMVLNAAALVGCWLWASGRCATSWRPAYAK